MKARVLDEQAIVHSAASSTSEIIGELHVGDEITLGKTVKNDGVAWVAVTLPSGVAGYVSGDIKVCKGEIGFIPGTTKIKETAHAGMFKNTDYMPFMLGVFLIGGLIGMPLTYGLGTGLSYFESLPWALASCIVFLIAFRRNGTISWGRAIPAMVAIMIGANAYNQSSGKPAFLAGGFYGFLLVMVCGYVGIGIGRIFKR